MDLNGRVPGATWMRRLLVLFILALCQCGEPTSSTVGSIRLRIADQPFPYAVARAVNLTVTAVAIRAVNAGNYQPVRFAPRAFDLIELQNGLTDTVSVASLPASSYDAIRLTFSHLSVQLVDGRTLTSLDSLADAPVEMAILSRSPISVKNKHLVDLVIDFDLSRSLTPVGNPSSVNQITGFVFTPTARIANLATVGQITGLAKHNNGTPGVSTDDVSISGLQIAIVSVPSRDTLTVVTDQQGQYTAFFIPAGTYTLFASETDSTREWSGSNIVVTTANPTRQDLITSVP